MADNENGIGSQVRRYARVGRSMGGLAAKLAGERYLGIEINRGDHAQELRTALGGLKGPLMKVAQILSTIPEALPKEYAQELSQLQADAPSMGPAFVKRRMMSELGPAWRSKFAEFEREAASAASLGQVHRAVSHDGDALACKLQYPDMKSAVEADLKQLKLIFSIYRRYDRSVDTTNIHAEIGERLREELDYGLEARHMALYRIMLADEQSVHVPEVFPELSTDRLLTMNWLEGKRLLSYKDAPLEQRNTLAMNMFRAWYVPFYGYGVIHGDPHLGNYTVRDDLTINLLDYGCIRTFRPHFVESVIDLYRAIRDGDRDLAVHAYKSWGFEGLNDEIIDTLNLWAEFVYAPLLEDRPRRIQEFGDDGVYGKDVAERVHRELKEKGGVTPPREFVFMDRAAIGLGGVFLHLKSEINWFRMFHDMIEDFDVETLKSRQTDAFGKADVPLP